MTDIWLDNLTSQKYFSAKESIEAIKGLMTGLVIFDPKQKRVIECRLSATSYESEIDEDGETSAAIIADVHFI